MRYTGGGHKQKYRIIDFKRTKVGIPATVKTIEYDPNRSAFISLLYYADGAKTYIIAQNGLQVGQTVVSGEDASPEIGNAMPLSKIPLGTVISCIELRPGQGAVIARSAGTFAQLMARDGKYATIKMPSGETRLILLTCSATIGAVSNSDHQLIVSGKAGRSRWLGRRPSILVCDEPTSALDGATGQRVMELIREQGRRPDRLVVLVTHDERIYHFADRIAHVDDGLITRIVTSDVELAALQAVAFEKGKAQ